MTDFDNHWLMMSPTGVSFNRDEMYVACRLSWDAALASRDAAVAGLVEALTFAAHEVYLDDSKLLAEIQDKAAGALRAWAAARTPSGGAT